MKISAGTTKGSLLSTGYPQTPGVYDEMSIAPGVLRPHWDTFIHSLSALGDVYKRQQRSCLASESTTQGEVPHSED